MARLNTLHPCLLAAFAVAPLLVACGDDDPSSTTGSGGNATATGGSTSTAGGGTTGTGGDGGGGDATGGGGGTGVGGGGDNPCGAISQTPDDPFTVDFGGDGAPFTFDPADGATNCLLTPGGFLAEFINLSDTTFFSVTIGTLALGQSYLQPGVSVTAAEGASINAEYEGPSFDFRAMDIGGYAYVSGDGTAADPFVGCLYDVTMLGGVAGSAGQTATMPAAVPIVCKAPGQ